MLHFLESAVACWEFDFIFCGENISHAVIVNPVKISDMIYWVHI